MKTLMFKTLSLRGARGLLAAGALALMPLAGCADDAETIVELTIVETIPVDFDDMAANQVEAAEIPLADLREETAYRDVAGDLRCAALNAEESFLRVETLNAPSGAAALSYEVSVRARGAIGWTKLVQYSGSVVNGQQIPFTTPGLLLLPSGLAEISRVALSSVPAMDVQVLARVGDQLVDLQVATGLALKFSSDAGGCPSIETGL